MVSMTSSRPYLIRALYQWIVDNDLTPYVVIDANAATVRVPEEHVENGRITLNISPVATQNLDLEGASISFEASFSGKVYSIYTPAACVLALYAKENGRGMVFTDEPEDEIPPPDDAGGSTEGSKSKGDKDKRPKLRIVK